MQGTLTLLQPGTIIRGRYVVQNVLGKRKFDAVYLVRDQRNKQNLFALQEVLKAGGKDDYQTAFESTLFRQLDHLALPHVYNVFHDDKQGRAYILMDYIEGQNLELLRLEQPEKRFPLLQIVTIIAPIIDAVSYLHGQQHPIIHGNIKPTNIIVRKKNAATMLVGVGTVKEYRLDAVSTDVHYDTLNYIAPEQYSREIDPRTDIYALGALIYTLLTGMVPIDAFSRLRLLCEQERDPLVQVNQVISNVPTAIANAIHCAMSIYKNDRFSTVEQFWNALWQVSDDSPIEQPTSKLMAVSPLEEVLTFNADPIIEPASPPVIVSSLEEVPVANATIEEEEALQPVAVLLNEEVTVVNPTTTVEPALEPVIIPSREEVPIANASPTIEQTPPPVVAPPSGDVPLFNAPRFVSPPPMLVPPGEIPLANVPRFVSPPPMLVPPGEVPPFNAPRFVSPSPPMLVPPGEIPLANAPRFMSPPPVVVPPREEVPVVNAPTVIEEVVESVVVPPNKDGPTFNASSTMMEQTPEREQAVESVVVPPDEDIPTFNSTAMIEEAPEREQAVESVVLSPSENDAVINATKEQAPPVDVAFTATRRQFWWQMGQSPSHSEILMPTRSNEEGPTFNTSPMIEEIAEPGVAPPREDGPTFNAPRFMPQPEEFLTFNPTTRIEEVVEPLAVAPREDGPTFNASPMIEQETQPIVVPIDVAPSPRKMGRYPIPTRLIPARPVVVPSSGDDSTFNAPRFVPQPQEVLTFKPTAKVTLESVSQPLVASSGPFQKSALSQEVKRPLPVSLPERPHNISRFRKPSMLFLILLALCVIVLISIVVGTSLWLYTAGQQQAMPTSAPQAKTALPTSSPNSKVTVTPSPAARYPNIAAHYSGTIYDVSRNLTTKMSLTGIQQQQGNIHGSFSGLGWSGPFQGTIDTTQHIHFVVTGNVGQGTLTFEGARHTDGTLGGTYCHQTQAGKCSYYGIWSISASLNYQQRRFSGA